MTLNPLKLLRAATDALGLTTPAAPPTGRVTLFDVRQQPKGLVQYANVERIHAIMEAADNGDPRDLFALYQEIILVHSHLQGEFGKRKLALLGDPHAILPKDKKAEDDVAAAAEIDAMIEGCPNWMGAMLHLLDSTMWPVALVEKVFEPMGAKFRLADLVPVPDQLLDFTEGRLRLRLTDERGTPNGQFAEVDPMRYIVHRGHLLTFPDHRGGPLRSLVWWWLLTTMDREWWVRFLERYGAPFLVGFYEQADDASRSILERAFSYATKIGGLVVSNETKVEIQQAGTKDAGEAYAKFIEIGNAEMSKLVVGQVSSSESKPTGIGGGVTPLHAQVRQDIRQWDGRMLGATLKRQLFAQFLRANRVGGEVPSIAWGGEDTESQALTGTLMQALASAGLEVTDEGLETLSERLGLPLQRVKKSPAPGAPSALDGRELALQMALLPLVFGARGHLLAAAPALAADSAGDSIAAAGSDELSRAFRGALAPVRRAIRESTSAEDLERRLKLLYADWPAARLAAVIEPALVAFAANGAVPKTGSAK